MPSNTLETDIFTESTHPISVLATDSFIYSPVVVAVTANLQINVWAFSAVAVDLSTLPTYNPSIITAVKRVYQNMQFPQFIIAGQGGVGHTQYALFKKSTTQILTILRGPVRQIGRDFDIMDVNFFLPLEMEAGTSIIPKLYFDNQRSSSVGTTININNFSNRRIQLLPKDFNNTVHGKHNYFIEFQFRGSALSPIALPIDINVDIYDK